MGICMTNSSSSPLFLLGGDGAVGVGGVGMVAAVVVDDGGVVVSDMPLLCVWRCLLRVPD